MKTLLNKFDTKYNSIPFDKINEEDYLPAIKKGIELAKKRIEDIKKEVKPNFENIIVALETCSDELDKAAGLYFSLYSLESSDSFKALAEEISPLTAKFSSEVHTDSELFVKVKSVYDNQNEFNLNNEEERLLENTYKGFTRNGALLKDSDKDKLKKIDEELSVLSPKFSKNVLDATNDFFVHLTKEEEVKGIPQNALVAAADLAKSKGFETGWVFTLQMPSMIPVLKYSENRDLRKKLNLAYGNKNLEGKFDNREFVLKTVQLRDKRAKLLGYDNHSSYVLEKRMASNPETVMSFLDDLFNYANPAAKKDLEEVKELAKRVDNLDDLQKWDIAYYAEKLKKEKFDFDSEELRPYLKSENVIEGIFTVAEKMYGITFDEIQDITKYHNDVKTYKALDIDGTYLGLLYVDLFPRETKRSGAWMDAFMSQGLQEGEIRRPHILISGNLTPSTSDSPALLSFDETRTVFHEFGHALHGLMSNVKFKSLASPNVYWDFVELPSQVMENWLLEQETLEIFAKHYETGEVMPIELIKKIKESQNFHAGSFSNRQLSLGYLDMAWHTTPPEEIKDVEKFEDKIDEKTRLLPKTPGNTSTGFGHIFAGGYSSGYYSYKWAEVLDADAFEYIKEKGIFNKEVCGEFRELLSKGNTVDPMDLYIKFRGQKPDAKALLRRDGLLS